MNFNHKMNPLISVIIPTYNHGQFIGKAIKSVLDQSHNNLEVIVVDNYSEDNTKEEIQSFQDDRIHYYRFRNNGIIAASRNYGVSKSVGEVIAFLDSDDEWIRAKLKKQVKHLFLDGVSCVGSNFTPIADVGLWRNHLKFRDGMLYQDYSYKDIVLQNPVVNSSAMMFMDTYIKLDGLDENPDFLAIEDWDLWMRAGKLGNIRILLEPLVNYRIHDNKRRDKRNVILKSFNLLKKHQSLGYLDEKLMREANGNLFIKLGKAYLDDNDWQGIKYYIRAFIFSKGFHNKLRAVVGVILFLIPNNIRRKIIKVLLRVSLVIQKYIYYKW